MLLSRKERFLANIKEFGVLCCPICGNHLSAEESSLRCTYGHVWNINKKGYVSFLSKPVESCYNEALFAARGAVFEAGCYLPVLEAITSLLPESQPLRLLDAGCGDGWYMDQLLSGHPGWKGSGIDISRDAIAKAAARASSAVWCVGDLRRPPYSGRSFDAVLDVLTPASYDSFLRLLKDDGLLIKVYPGTDYLKEIREARGLPAYQEGKVDAWLREKVQAIDTRHVHHTFAADDALWRNFVRMTPMNQDLDEASLEKLSERNPGSITVDLFVTAARG